MGKPIELTGSPNVEPRVISSQAFDKSKEGPETIEMVSSSSDSLERTK